MKKMPLDSAYSCVLGVASGLSREEAATLLGIAAARMRRDKVGGTPDITERRIALASVLRCFTAGWDAAVAEMGK